MSRRKKHKVKKIALLLGLSGAAVAASAAAVVWAWSPLAGNWTLVPRPFFDSTPQFETAERPITRPSSSWVSLSMAPEGEKSGLPMIDVALNIDGEGGTGPQDFTETATEETPGSDPTNATGFFGPASGGSGTGNYNNHFGMFSSGGFGGGGSSWPGTINPNPSRGPAIFGPSSTPGGSAGGGGPTGDKCAFEPAKSQDPTCLTNNQQDAKNDTDGDKNKDSDENENEDGSDGNDGSSGDDGSNGGNSGGSAGGSGSTGGSGGDNWNCTTVTVNGVTTQYGNCGNNDGSNGNGGTGDETPPTQISDENPPCIGVSCGTEPNLVLVPEPGALAMFLVGLLGLGRMVRRRA